MSLSIYFVKPGDTSIAGENSSFIEALEHVANSMSGIRVMNKPDTADVVLIDERYQYRTWHYADDLARCRIVRRHIDRIYVINHDDYARPFLPGLYVSLEASRPPLVDALPIPYKWDLWHVPAPVKFDFQPEQLFAFRGTFHTHPVRKKICRVLSQSGLGTCEELRKEFHDHSEDDQQSYIKGIQSARFSLCPRGLSPSSYRLYESMQLGRCPVVISDDWIAPPGPDWDSFTIFVSESEVKNLPMILMDEFECAESYGRLAYDTWKEFFSWPRRWLYFIEQICHLKDNQREDYKFDRLYELWTGSLFRRRYRWTLLGRAQQLVGRKLSALISRPVFTVNS